MERWNPTTRLALGLFILLCAASGARSETWSSYGKVNVICDACLDFSAESQIILSDPETQRQVVDLLTQLACQSLTTRLKAKCVDMVNIYVPDAFAALQAYLRPEFCTESGLCTDVTEPESIGKLLHLILATNTKITVDSVEKRHVNAPDLGDLLRKVTPVDCAFCQFVVLELKTKLKDPSTQVKILDVLLNGCNRVQNHVDECKLIVDQYAPFILANLDTILDADVLCAKLGVCTRTITEDQILDEPVLVLPSEGRHMQRLHAF